MIEVHRLNGEVFYLNPYLIETLEEKPDTVIQLTTDKKLIVQEKISDIIVRIIEFNRRIFIERHRTE